MLYAVCIVLAITYDTAYHVCIGMQASSLHEAAKTAIRDLYCFVNHIPVLQ